MITVKSRNPRKGIVYTLFVMAFLLSLTIFVMIQGNDYQGSLVSEKIRGDEVGYFVNGVQDDMGRGILISSRKAVLSLVNNETDSGVFVADANDSIAELLQNGSINGVELDIMTNSTLSAWMLALKEIAKGRSIELNITAENFDIYQGSPFELTVADNTTVVAYDPLTRVKYNRTFTIRRKVSIEELEDPYITIRSFAARRSIIRKCSSIGGTPAPGSQWTYGAAFVSESNDLSWVPSKGSKILVTNTLSGKDQNDYLQFNATVTEDNSPLANLSGASGAYDAAKNDSYIIISSNVLWLSNFTSCYFDAPAGPSFLDRLEGRGQISQKYNVSGGIGSFLYFPPDYKMDYSYYG